MTRLLRAGTFSDRVAILLLAQIISAGINIFNSFFFARLLGPAGKGDYYLLVLVPTTIMVLIQFGLARALGFYAARGQTKGIVARALLLAAVISAVAFVIAVAALPALRKTILHGPEPAQIVLGLCAIPLLLTATFATAIVVGRQAVRWYATVSVVQAVSATFLLAILVGALGLGVNGAVTAFLVVSLLSMVGLVLGAKLVSATEPDAGSVTYRQLFRYGLPLYPGSVTTFFSSRIDVFLLAGLLAEASAPLGWYSMAVSAAEMVFLLPEAVSTVFFPHVAASSRNESDRQVAMVSRVTLCLTAIGALLVAPFVTVMIALLLPAFGPALPALYVLLPGVVSLSVAKVVTDYISGLGKTGMTSAIYVGAFAVNVAINLVLIPRFGIVGASAASLVSYSTAALAATVIAARLAGASPLEFWLITRNDLGLAIASLRSLRRRFIRKAAPEP
jgi:O-antigen/teichoic acid export membrane protein